ncbi:MAG TPA: hypothetical protein VME92_17020 [Acetobacteraceae bacterium]|nr:hypothetical protein [Acetobacteraceae bacterium]
MVMGGSKARGVLGSAPPDALSTRVSQPVPAAGMVAAVAILGAVALIIAAIAVGGLHHLPAPHPETAAVTALRA